MASLVACRGCGSLNRVRPINPAHEAVRCGRCGRDIGATLVMAGRTRTDRLSRLLNRFTGAVSGGLRWVKHRWHWQPAIVLAGSVLAIALALFPPWTLVFARGSLQFEEQTRSFLMAPPVQRRGDFGFLKSVRLDLTRLMVEETVIGAITVGLVYALRRGLAVR